MTTNANANESTQTIERKTRNENIWKQRKRREKSNLNKNYYKRKTSIVNDKTKTHLER